MKTKKITLLMFATLLLSCAQKAQPEKSTTAIDPLAMAVVPPVAVSDSSPMYFPLGLDDTETASITSSFELAKTQVTYKFYKEIYDWATNGDCQSSGQGCYKFENIGWQGSQRLGWTDNPNGSALQPVSSISFRDAIVWTNALSEWHNAKKGSTYKTVYKNASNESIRSSRNDNTNISGEHICDIAVVDASADGFRLPTKDEWEFAARFQGVNNLQNSVARVSHGVPYYFTKGNSFSGATKAFYDSASNSEVAWFQSNSDGKTQAVASKKPNALGIYDMSGNTWEWCFDSVDVSTRRAAKGGSYTGNKYSLLRIGYTASYNSNLVDNELGFRFARQKIAKIEPVTQEAEIFSAGISLASQKTLELAEIVNTFKNLSAPLSWQTSDPTTATVDAYGKVTALSEGIVFITAISSTNEKAVTRIIVTNEDVEAFEIKINPVEVGLAKNSSLQLVAQLIPNLATHSKITWTSSDSSIASVANGKITALSVGNVNITAKIGSSLQTTTNIKVTATPVAISSLSIEPSNLELFWGENMQLVAKTNNDASLDTQIPIEWKSDNASVVKVDQNGKITAMDCPSFSCTQTITAKAGSVTATTTVKVSLFTMAKFPSITLTAGGFRFPTGVEDLPADDKFITQKFSLGKTEVTYKLWKKVYDWATDSGGCQTSAPNMGKGCYSFDKVGQNGSMNMGSVLQPVVGIHWRDAMVWTNALSEWHNAEKSTALVTVYNNASHPIRDARATNAAICDAVSPDNTANGFRLPTSQEWEFFARFQGTNALGSHTSRMNNGITYYFTVGSGLSGAFTYYNHSNSLNGQPAKTANAEVGIYGFYYIPAAWPWVETGVYKTAATGSKKPNALGVYDMSGNASEWMFESAYPSATIGDVNYGKRRNKGGSYNSISGDLRTGHSMNPVAPTVFARWVGFRVAQNE